MFTPTATLKRKRDGGGSTHANPAHTAKHRHKRRHLELLVPSRVSGCVQVNVAAARQQRVDLGHGSFIAHDVNLRGGVTAHSHVRDMLSGAQLKRECEVKHKNNSAAVHKKTRALFFAHAVL